MTPDLKLRWLSALRSGRYAQGTGTLCCRYEGSPRQFCCLGVLADVAFGDKWARRPELTSQKYSHLDHPDVGATSTLSSRVRDKLDLSDQAQQNLIDLNDVKQASFAEIARWIENNL